MTPQLRFRHRGRSLFYPGGYTSASSVAPVSPDSCGCKASNGLEQKIKENPLVFVAGALLIGYFLAKKR